MNCFFVRSYTKARMKTLMVKWKRKKNPFKNPINARADQCAGQILSRSKIDWQLADLSISP
jgi:hypothetical protein